MLLDGRDRAVVQLVARFKQLRAAQVQFALFADSASRTSCDRTLKRLTDQKFLARIERRAVGGSRGGSGQYVYCLGRRGFYLYYTGAYQQARAINYHMLAIADAYLALVAAKRAGQLEITALSTEPDCWVNVGGVELKPDMYVEVVKTDGERLKLWFEVDMGSESQTRLRAKLATYWRAYSNADVSDWPVFPRVLFVAVDTERETELRWLISQLPEASRPLFEVTTVEGLPQNVIS